MGSEDMFLGRDPEVAGDLFAGYLAAMREDNKQLRSIDPMEMKPSEYQAHFRAMVMGLQSEVQELVDEFRWKSWKGGDCEVVSPWRAACEAADILHFLAHVLECAGVDDVVLNEAMRQERSKNRQRVRSGAYTY